jgi:hypothetical protein
MPIGQESDFFFHFLIRPVNLPQKPYGFFTILLDVKQGEFETCYSTLLSKARIIQRLYIWPLGAGSG